MNKRIGATLALLSSAALLPAAAPLTAQAADEKKSEELSTIQEMSAEWLSKSYGLDGEEAKRRVKDQDGHAQKAKDIEGDLGDKTAGSFIDQKRGKLVVTVTDEKAVDKVKEKDKNADVRVVKNSASKLNDSKKNAEDKVGDKMAASYVDVERNVVVLTVPKDKAEEAKKQVKDVQGVEVQEVEATIEAQANLYGGQEIQFGRSVCSVGFPATKDGKNVFITAGHCAAGGQAFRRNGQNLGKPVKYNFPGPDMAYSTMENGWNGVGAVDHWNGKAVAVAGSQEAPVGATVCKSGRTTRWTCGVIQAKNVTVRYGKPGGGQDIVRGMTQANVCSEGGDSGGSWIAGNQAQGVTSGGAGYGPNKSCGEKVGRPNVAYFQPLNPILKDYGLKLTTHNGGKGGGDNGGDRNRDNRKGGRY
ncbi:streptogrisin C. Serine peptidase. MEROPS family S01A [Austwickia chelonae]|uniref:Putative peptidase n=1 Tax=Austwickia chelonae NBRC 105200 TaxID=1184607 RepID=K6VM97_9MICO|nr:S1 family peptidase [Austwickia chelonae]GAB77874.1 putative peptidase [Austwickia chelonae NBRC 105200]SEV91303.1 streptogrisin C. Serine peptidase. MEROPS family S01A [Austwickia chelonae]